MLVIVDSVNLGNMILIVDPIHDHFMIGEKKISVDSGFMIAD